MLQMLQEKLDELDEITDQKFIFKTEKEIPHIHWFEMKKSGKGWRTIRYTAEFCRVQCPIGLNDDELTDMPMYNSGNLSGIKKAFPSSAFSCIVEGHMTAPSTLYQLVIDGITDKQKEDFLEYMKKYKHGIYCDYWIDTRWFDQLLIGQYELLTVY